MATISDLNIRLGVVFDDLALRKVENSLRASGRRLSSLGSDLTLAISAPLGALGFQAIKAAGDMEALRLAMRATFDGAGRSMQEADKELKALQKAALAPGLEFEQAVRGSIRLQAVGFTAEKARAVIAQLANTLATTGGTAEDLGEVVNQFGQMIGKGKVFQDDIKIILGRMPKLAQIMKETFGTTTAEGINALGVDARTFVETVTTQMEKLPRVSGGISNSLVNIGASVKHFLAGIGEEINKAFNLGEVGDQLTATLQGAVKSFSELDDGTKRTIVQFGALLVAVGPIIKVWGVMRSTGAQLIGMYRDLGGGLASLKGFAQDTAKGFSALDAATKAFVVIGIVTAIATLAYNMGLFNRELTTTERTQKAVNDVYAEASREIAGNRAQVERLTGIIQDSTTTDGQKLAALEKLKKISPEYYGSLALAKGQVVGLTAANDKYLQSLFNTAKAAAAQSKLVEIQKQIVDLEIRKNEVATTGEKLLLSFQRVGFNNENGRQKILNAEITALKGQAAAVGKIITETENLASVQTTAGGASTTLAGDIDKTRKSAELLAQAIVRIDAASESVKPVVIREEITGLRKAGLKESSPEVLQLRAMQEQLKSTKGSADEYRRALEAIDAVAGKGDVLGANVVGEQAREIESQIERLLGLGFNRFGTAITGLRERLVALRTDVREGFGFQNATQEAVAQTEQLSGLIGTLLSVQNGSAAWRAAVDELVAAYPNYLSRLDVENVSMGQLVALQQQLTDAIYKNIDARRAQQNERAGGPAPAALPQLPTLPLPTSVQSESPGAPNVQGMEVANETLTRTLSIYQQLGIQFDAMSEKMLAFQGNWGQMSESLMANGRMLDGVMLGLGESMVTAFSEAASGSRSFAQVFVQQAAKVIGAAIRMAVIEAALSALQNTPWPYNLIIAGVAGAAAEALFTSMVNSIAAPKLAEGGVIRRPTLALVGEYPGARSNPEIVTPERKMSSVFRSELAAAFARYTPAGQSAPMAALARGGVITRPTVALLGETAASRPEIAVPDRHLRDILRDEMGQGTLEASTLLRGDDLLLVVTKAAQRRGRKT